MRGAGGGGGSVRSADKRSRVAEETGASEKKQTTHVEYGEIRIFGFLTSGKKRLRPSRADDICLVYPIYYLIIHHVFRL